MGGVRTSIFGRPRPLPRTDAPTTATPLFVKSQIAGGSVKWGQLPVYLAAELIAGVLAALLYGLLTTTPADRHASAGPGVDLGDPELEPTVGGKAATSNV